MNPDLLVDLIIDDCVHIIAYTTQARTQIISHLVDGLIELSILIKAHRFHTFDHIRPENIYISGVGHPDRRSSLIILLNQCLRDFPVIR